MIIRNSLFVGLSGLLRNDRAHVTQIWWVGGAWSNLEFLSNFLANCYHWSSLQEFSLTFSDVLGCTWLKLGAWVELGPT